MYETELRRAVRALPADLRRWMAVALRQRKFAICSGQWQGSDDESMCPVAAAADLAGAWGSDGIAPGWAAWGGPDGPSEAVEDFAAWFDLLSGETGLGRAVLVVRFELERSSHEGRSRRRGSRRVRRYSQRPG
jgi:hypothetical protein